MRKAILLSILILSSLTAFAQRNTTTNHSVSATTFGLEYSYEKAFGTNWSFIGRAGLDSYRTAMVSTLDSFSFESDMFGAVTIEPRFYTSMGRRKELGRETYNNSADFVSVRNLILLTGDGPELRITPMYGIRRSSGQHWIHEFTFGTSVALGEIFGITPHLQYRIGFVF